VDDVVTVPAGAVRPPPQASAADRGGYVLGVARVDGALLTLIDLAELLRDHTTFSPGERP
ncbi:MAG TPA: hypothetical protein VFX98_18570, partial [Longimicrobiaceae bacterium]|nr:hypothetical protein [Longimicrobiaceae bacterium]